MWIILAFLLVLAVGRFLREWRRTLGGLPRSNRDWVFF